MFALPAPEEEATAEGQTDDNPLKLEGIKKEEFRALLRVMMRPHHCPTDDEQVELTMEEWIHVLKLSTIWQFTRLRRVAINKLTPLIQAAEDSVRWLSLARRYTVNEWLLPALQALAQRERALQLHEVEPLGIATVVKIAEVRESFTTCQAGHMHGYYSSTSRAQHDFLDEIRQLFAEELRRAGV
ncbi:hypothetical protein BD414DRAFT_503479 [Trametes punicea]|nr:hypothetical protein BD414DRAFT_503479 [Trametes punicea]